METRGGKIPEYIYKQMMECMMKDWQNDAIRTRIFDSWEKAGHPDAKQVNEIIWWM